MTFSTVWRGLLAAVLAVLTLAGCAAVPDTEPDVYFLNYKPEQEQAWLALAAAYTGETGIPVRVVTPPSGLYSASLPEELPKQSAPTLFQVNGPVSLRLYENYCLDLTGTPVLGELSDDRYALKQGDRVLGIGYVVETYGIIANKTLLARAGYTPDDITCFADLKRVAEDITARREVLGFSAFTSAGLSTSSDWRFRTHLANLPLYYEFRDRGLGLPDSVPRLEGLYLDNYRAIFDLYLQNATCPPTDLISKSGEDSLQEFLNREAVFYQNGSWEYAHLTGEGGLRDEEMIMLPIYIGVEGEESQGLCTGTENYWCVNCNASEVDRQATLDFLYWCVTSPTGTAALAREMHFAIPFRQAQPTDNIFLQQDLAMAAAGKTPVDWCFYTMPSTKWKSSLGSALAAYACGKKGWEGVQAAFVDGWGAETALLEK